MDDETKSSAQSRLQRIAGQAVGVLRMLDGDRSYGDVLLQLAAVRAAVTETAQLILGGHVEDALLNALKNRDPRERRKTIDELLDLLSRFYQIDSKLSAIDPLEEEAAPAGRDHRRRER